MADDLSPDFQHALDTIVDELSARSDIAGILFFGSAARGTAGPRSDLDLYAVTTENAGGNLGRRIGSVPIELAFGSLEQWEAKVRQELRIVVHAFATGRILLDRTDGALARLCASAAALWQRGPEPLSASGALRFRFHLTDIACDLEDLPERSVATALMAAECARLAVEAYCAANQRWLPATRELHRAIEGSDPELAAAIRRCAEAGFPGSLAVEIADRVLAGLGGRLEAYDTWSHAITPPESERLPKPLSFVPGKFQDVAILTTRSRGLAVFARVVTPIVRLTLWARRRIATANKT